MKVLNVTITVEDSIAEAAVEECVGNSEDEEEAPPGQLPFSSNEDKTL